MEWIDVKDELPGYGIPVLLKSNGVVQHVTYMLNGSDDEADWFEPFYFEHDDNCKLRWDMANAWQYLPEVHAPELSEISLDQQHLQWVFNRMLEIHGEKSNYDYMIKFQSIIDNMKG